MKLVNPVGREVKSGLEASYHTLACMCSANMFASAQGNDSCFHCGCACSSDFYNAGNDANAWITIRKS